MHLNWCCSWLVKLLFLADSRYPRVCNATLYDIILVQKLHFNWAMEVAGQLGNGWPKLSSCAQPKRFTQLYLNLCIPLR